MKGYVDTINQIWVYCAKMLGTPIVGDCKYGQCVLKNQDEQT